MTNMLFYLLVSIAIVSSIVVISARNPIHSILGLISVVITTVIILIYLGAEFLALSFVTVYLGAVVVLFLFIVMMLNIKSLNFSKEIIHTLPISSFFGLIFFYFIYIVNSKATSISNISNIFFYENYFDWKSIVYNVTNLESIGFVLYTHFAPFLLIVGIILLVAMLGSVILTKENYINKSRKKNFIDQQVSRKASNSVFYIKKKK